MYVDPDDMEVGMFLLGMMAERSYQTVTSLGTVETLTNCIYDEQGKIYRIKAIQFPLILVEMVWNSDNVCFGMKRFLNVQYQRFQKPSPELLKELGIT